MRKLKHGDGCVKLCRRKRKDGTERRFYHGKIYINGKQQSVYGKTQAECFEKLKELKKEKVRQEQAATENTGTGRRMFRTYGDWLDEWVKEFKAGKLRDDYFKDFKRRVDVIRAALGERPLNKLAALDLLHYLNSLPRCNETNKRYDVLNGSLQAAEDYGIIRRNPCRAVERPKYNEENRRAFELSEQAEILAALNERYSKLFFFLCCTGLRIGEFLALHPDDVDFRRHCIQVNKSLSLKTGKLTEETKTAAGERNVYFADELFKAFDLAALGSYTYNGIKKAFNKVYKHLKIEGVSVTHSCRHTFASLLYAVHVPDKVIQLQMGHASVKTTMDTYTDILLQGSSPILNYIRLLKSTLKSTLIFD